MCSGSALTSSDRYGHRTQDMEQRGRGHGTVDTVMWYTLSATAMATLSGFSRGRLSLRAECECQREAEETLKCERLADTTHYALCSACNPLLQGIVCRFQAIVFFYRVFAMYERGR